MSAARLQEAMAARLAADVEVAGASEALPGGLTQLRCAAFPDSNDLNALWVPFGAGQAVLDAAVAYGPRRVTAPAPASDVVAPAGWELDAERLLLAPAEAPEWPAEVEAVAPEVLHEARLAVWGGQVEDPALADQLARMQLALASHPSARVLAVLRGGEPVAWVQVVAGAIDDVWVQPAARGTGLGRAVTRAAQAAGGWYLGVAPDNAVARALYASEGFEDAGRLVVLAPDGG